MPTMLSSHLKAAVLLATASPLLTSLATAALVINTPSSLVSCLNASISWSGAGGGPVYIAAFPKGDVSKEPFYSFPAQNDASGNFSWTVNIPAGVTVTLGIRDGVGSTQNTAPIAVQAPPADAKSCKTVTVPAQYYDNATSSTSTPTTGGTTGTVTGAPTTGGTGATGSTGTTAGATNSTGATKTNTTGSTTGTTPTTNSTNTNTTPTTPTTSSTNGTSGGDTSSASAPLLQLTYSFGLAQTTTLILFQGVALAAVLGGISGYLTAA